MLELMDPELHDGAPTRLGTLAPRLPVTGRLRLTLIDNGKPKAHEILADIAAGLSDRLPIGSVEFFDKGVSSRTIDEEEAGAIAARSDLVIAGVGDCTNCSACSLGDAIRIEKEGTPATVVITDVWLGNIAEFSRKMGMPNYHSATLPHPIASKSDAQIHAHVADVLDAIVRQLTTDPDGAETTRAARHTVGT